MPIDRQERPWGFYEIVDAGDGFQVKRICVRGGKRLSYQRHAKRTEHWYVVSGVGVAIIDDVEQRVERGSSIDIAQGAAHRVANDGDDDLVFVEVQTGSYFGEDDIERLSDDYGRDPAKVI
jgi:mannose-6-phosphate isomerase